VSLGKSTDDIDDAEIARERAQAATLCENVAPDPDKEMIYLVKLLFGKDITIRDEPSTTTRPHARLPNKLRRDRAFN